jgi:hypothetical protein
MADIAKSADENPAPVLGAPDRESPEATRARLHAWHKENGTLGLFHELYGERRERRQELREALERHIEGSGHTPVTKDPARDRGLER